MKSVKQIFEQVQEQDYAQNFEDPNASRQQRMVKNSLRKKRADIRRALEYDRNTFIQHIIVRMDSIAPMMNKKLYEVTVGDLVVLFDRGIDFIRRNTANEEFEREYSQYGHEFIRLFYAIKRGKIIPDSANPFLPRT